MLFKQKLKSELKQTNGLKQIRNVLSTIIYTYNQQQGSFSDQILPAIKDILLDLVDEIWNSTQKLYENPETKIVIKRNLSGCSTRQKFLNYETQNLEKFAEKKQKFPEIISEFSYAKGPSFSRSIREIDKKVVSSPGPACYKLTRNDTMSTPPRVVFPKVTKRDSYIPTTYSPGPAKYYSNLRGVSKH